MKAIECSQYDSRAHACRSGHVGINGVCFGIVHIGCKSCGAGDIVAPCMREERAPHLVREDGLPLNWPKHAKDPTNEQ